MTADWGRVVGFAILVELPGEGYLLWGMRILPILSVMAGYALCSCLPREDVPPMDSADVSGGGLDIPSTGEGGDELSGESVNERAASLEQAGAKEAVVAGEAEWMGLEWVLVGLAGDEVVDGVVTTFSVDEHGQATGRGGVNRYGGTFAVDGEGGIEAGPFMSTRMAGPPEAMEQEREFLALLAQAVAAEVVDGELRIECEGRTEPLRFRLAEPEL